MKISSNGSSKQEISWLLREKYNNIQTEEFFQDIEKLAKGEHIDYVIGFVEFLGCKIDLSQKPLIPRAETEYWVEKAIQEIMSRLRKRNSEIEPPTPRKARGRALTPQFQNSLPSSSPLRVLDMFAGSGCIGIAIQKHVPGAVVTFAEKEEKFCRQIAINGGKNIIQSDIFSAFWKQNLFSPPFGQYDYILANPPYVPEEAEVQQSVLDNEPYDAVFAGKDGLDYIKRFLQEAKNHLKEHGVIYMEFDPEQKEAIAHIVKKEKYLAHEFFKDQYSKWRYIKIQKGRSQ
ncbi:peptide chain release factor N(5)-glutamine methyltransferase [Patescibacteria group bacterium]|nr:peptide chain release factor N(5)-glutamine methyltransferase [Patescibacteria group bacterium]